jgi:transposase
MVTRGKIILMADDGLNNQYIADDLGIHIQTPRRWRNRWAEASERLKDTETDLDDKALCAYIKEMLSDEPRSGAPATFTPEQICQLVALSCEPPGASERPITHWTHAELADEAIKRDIVESISPRSVGRFLKGRDPETAFDAILAEQ